MHHNILSGNPAFIETFAGEDTLSLLRCMAVANGNAALKILGIPTPSADRYVKKWLAEGRLEKVEHGKYRKRGNEKRSRHSGKGALILCITAYVIVGATSVAIGSTVKLVFPHVGDVYGNLFMAIVGTRGSNKISPILEAIGPLLILDNQYVKESAAAFREYDRQKAKGEFPDPPVSRRVMVQDITTETLLEKLDENPRGLGLYVDELASTNIVKRSLTQSKISFFPFARRGSICKS